MKQLFTVDDWIREAKLVVFQSTIHPNQPNTSSACSNYKASEGIMGEEGFLLAVALKNQ